MKFVYLLLAVVTLNNGDNMVLHRATVESKRACLIEREKFETAVKQLKDVNTAKALCLKIENTRLL